MLGDFVHRSILLTGVPGFNLWFYIIFLNSEFCIAQFVENAQFILWKTNSVSPHLALFGPEVKMKFERFLVGARLAIVVVPLSTFPGCPTSFFTISCWVLEAYLFCLCCNLYFSCS
jgi:hypothetical protein